MSELHNRLAHLVNYSSQLIFVSGDSVADQQRTLNDFLSKQQENTEISFFAAAHTKKETDYRAMICRQLGGHTVGSFVRPLNQLLIDIAPDDGPFLVCITQADLLSDAFLQELWDWVMHAQQFNRKLHLNIILFGQSDWAQTSQEWLPSQNSHKPVLLSSQSVDPVGFDVNALEALMAQDKQWFAGASSPIVTNKWFIGGVLGLFLCVFVGLLSWQYPQHVKGLLAGSLPQATELPAFDIDETKIDKDVVLPNEEQNTHSDYRQQIELIDDTQLSLTDTILVTTWRKDNENNSTEAQDTIGDQAQATLNDAVNPLLEQEPAITNTPPAAQTPTNVSNNTATNDAAINGEAVNAGATNIASGAEELDFQVPDIISVEQLDATLSATLGTTEPVNPTFTSNQDEDATNTAEIATTGQAAIDYRFDETTLLALPIDAVVLQLSGIQNPIVLENYLNNNNLKANTWVYQTQRYGGPWYVVVYRQSFDSIDAALNLLSSLPDDVKDTQPFAKSVNQIQQEIQQR